MTDYCKGCGSGSCDLTMFNEGYIVNDSNDKPGKCPCVNCLIKMICNVSCDEYDNWRFINLRSSSKFNGGAHEKSL